MRGPGNFAKVIEAIPRLVDRGISVRIATTVEHISDEDLSRLCALHRDLGVSDADHILRPVVRRGRAVEHGMGVDVGVPDLPAELTITADGAFWSPFWAHGSARSTRHRPVGHANDEPVANASCSAAPSRQGTSSR